MCIFSSFILCYILVIINMFSVCLLKRKPAEIFPWFSSRTIVSLYISGLLYPRIPSPLHFLSPSSSWIKLAVESPLLIHSRILKGMVPKQQAGPKLVRTSTFSKIQLPSPSHLCAKTGSTRDRHLLFSLYAWEAWSFLHSAITLS